jgi:hypothetical protein
MQPSGAPVERDFYFVTFCVKHLVAHVCFPTEPTPTGIQLWKGGGGKFSACLWPPEVTPLTPLIWPPPTTLPWETALDLPDSVTRIRK